MGLEYPALFVAALLAGALNSVAGGGSFITFPALLLSGVSPVHANATSTVALWPGTVASVAAYRREIGAAPNLLPLTLISLLGGGLGAVLLLHTPVATFSRLVPYLLLIATLLFAFSGQITTRLPRLDTAGGSSRRTLIAVLAVQLVIASYGGYFGGGIGILMLAVMGLMGLTDINQMNGLKTLLASAINGIAVVAFVVAGAVEWPQALVMLAGGVIGGYGGAAVARRLDPRLVRRFALGVACTMTSYFFIHR